MMRLAVFSCALVAVVFAGAWSAGQTPLKRSSGDDSSPARSAAAFSNVPPAEANPYPAPRRGEQARSSGRAIALDVTIAEFADSAKSAVSLPLESGQKTLDRIRELESQGKVALVTRVRLATVDARPAMLQIGEQASTAAARRFGGGRPAREGGGFEAAATSFVRQNVGLLIGATPRVQSDGSLTVDLDLEKSQISARSPRDGGEGAPPGVATMKTQSTVHIPAGQTVIVGGTQMASPSESGQTIVLVSGQVLAGAAGKDRSGDPATAAHEEPATKIFHLHHASAATAAKAIHTLYRGTTTLMCAADERTNSIIARGSAKELAEMEAVLERLDAAGK